MAMSTKVFSTYFSVWLLTLYKIVDFNFRVTIYAWVGATISDKLIKKLGVLFSLESEVDAHYLPVLFT
jgi:hypothetical protein